MRTAHHVISDRIGVDLGGTKIEAIRMAPDGSISARHRVASPQHDYAATIAAIQNLVARLEADGPIGASYNIIPVGIGIPGSLSKRTGRVHNANSTWLNGRDLRADVIAALGRAVSIANDANCFALSEATDGAGAGAATVLGVILGTGTGSGIVIIGRIVDGPLGIGGEIGHNPLPWPKPDVKPELNEVPGPQCWCGRFGCLETWVSGPGLSADHARVTGARSTSEAIAAAAASGDSVAIATLDRHAGRLARGLAHVVNIVDPDVIVLGGGLSNFPHLYEALPKLMSGYIFSDDANVDIRPPKWGDASGVRGAAWLAEI